MYRRYFLMMFLLFSFTALAIGQSDPITVKRPQIVKDAISPPLDPKQAKLEEASASGWILVGKAKTGRTYYYKELKYTTSRSIYPVGQGKTDATAWIKVIPTMTPALRKAHFGYFLVLWTFHCSERTMSTSRDAAYDTKDEVLREYTDLYYQEPIAPGTFYEKLFSTFCKP